MKRLVGTIISALSLSFPFAAHSQERAMLWITTTNEVHFVITDPNNRKAGRDPRGSTEPWIGTPVNEIPGVNYAFETPGDSPVDNSSDRREVMHRLSYRLVSPTNDGKYLIELLGIESGFYRLFIRVEPDDSDKIQRFTENRRGLVRENGTIMFTLSYYGEHGRSSGLSKRVESKNIRQDIAASHDIGHLGDTKLVDDWNKELDKIERDLSKKDSAKARQELEKFGKEVDKLRQETVKHEEKKVPKPAKFITQDAYQVIREDIDILLKQLPMK